MWVYIRTESQLWTVGFYDPSGKWHSESDHDSKEEAAKRVNFLNGGKLRDEYKPLLIQLLYAIETMHKPEYAHFTLKGIDKPFDGYELFDYFNERINDITNED